MIFSSQEAGEMENKMMEGIAKKNVHNLKDAPREFLWKSVAEGPFTSQTIIKYC